MLAKMFFEPLVNRSGTRRFVICRFLGRKAFAKASDQIGMFFVAGEICPLVWVLLMIVEFFGTIFVPDIAVSLGTQCVVAKGVRRLHGESPTRVGVFHQRS